MSQRKNTVVAIDSPDKDSMTKANYDKAEWILIKQAQSDKINEQQINTWNLCYDKTDNLWRSKSRIENADLDTESKFPIHLPNRNHITKLIIKHKHEELYHAGIGHTLCELRQKFWIPSGRSAVKRTINECMACKRWKANPFKLSLMPNLPESRIKKSRIFEQVGPDYLGPLSIKNDTGIVKRWIALFTCFTTRAVYLEPVETYQLKYSCIYSVDLYRNEDILNLL
uniref:Integrase_H2C2 domain-containing protein n=1 Tax=Loa loa TaxID=7209 RepID=A0A1I7W001_LOALO